MVSSDAGGGSLGRVLVFDDMPEVAQALELKVKSMGYQTLTFTDPFEAINQSETFRPDVAVMDIRVDKEYSRPIDGILAFQKIRELNPSVEPVFVTAFTENQAYIGRAKRFDPIILGKTHEYQELQESLSRQAARSREKQREELEELLRYARTLGVPETKLLGLWAEFLQSVEGSEGEVQGQGIDEGLQLSDRDALVEIREAIDLVDAQVELLEALRDIFGRELPEASVRVLLQESAESVAAAREYDRAAKTLIPLLEGLDNEE
ncbi:MAG: response regulator [Acidobacteriota bacterium]|nr:response regulator [Acidobacteriota bacterium]